MTDLKLQELFEKFAAAFIKVYGKEKWNNMTGQEQHDAIMFVIKDLNNSMN